MKLDLGVLILRLGAGGMLLTHGWPKLMKFSAYAQGFPSVFGLGGKVSLCLAIFGEVVCALAVMVGLRTKITAIPPLITMLVAGLVIHAADPWSKKELALLFATCFLTLALTGSGRFSLDTFIDAKKAG